MITISPTCFERLKASHLDLIDERHLGAKIVSLLRGNSRKAKQDSHGQPSCLYLCMGSHVLKKPPNDHDRPKALLMHQAISPSLSPRLALFSPLRTHEKLELDALEAPIGHITIAFANLVGASTLMAWDQKLAHRALDLFSSHASQLLHDAQGYIVEMTQDGLCLAAFAQPLDAVVWAAGLIEVLKHADWDAELLEHELCEEVVVATIGEPSGRSLTLASASKDRSRRQDDPLEVLGGHYPPSAPISAPLGTLVSQMVRDLDQDGISGNSDSHCHHQGPSFTPSSAHLVI